MSLLERRTVAEVRHHLVTIAAVDQAMRPDGEAARHARIALAECIRTLKIAPEEITRRRLHMGLTEVAADALPR